jgi:membrane-bound metal-dependent hydrolase YbcI (DUF457 family)
MMRKGHKWFAPIPLLAGTAVANGILIWRGFETLAPSLVACATAPLAKPFSAGRNSPDIDHLWAPGPPRNYHWKGHRGITHRVWFACLLTTIWTLAFMLPYWRYDWPGWTLWLLPVWLVPMSGWWSHLFGDMLFGRLPVHYPRRRWARRVDGTWGKRWVMWSVNVGTGWKTGGERELWLTNSVFPKLTVVMIAGNVAAGVYSMMA